MPSKEKAKGKGKGNKGKRKKGKGKGKGKGKDGKGKPPGKTAPGDGARSESRQCFKCWEYGHLGKDCPLPDRRKSAKLLEESSAGDAASNASSAHGNARSLTTARVQLCTMKIRPPSPG